MRVASRAAYVATMRRILPAVVLALTVALMLTGAGAAQAKPHPDHASVSDKAGEVPAGIDLISGTYAISKKGAKFTAKVKALTDTTFLAFEISPLNEGWDRLAVYRENGRTVAKVYWIDNSLEDSDEPVPHLVKCPNLKASWNSGTDRVSVTWPSGCMVMSKPFGLPFVLQAFSRFGGVHNSRTDALPPKTLDF